MEPLMRFLVLVVATTFSFLMVLLIYRIATAPSGRRAAASGWVLDRFRREANGTWANNWQAILLVLWWLCLGWVAWTIPPGPIPEVTTDVQEGAKTLKDAGKKFFASEEWEKFTGNLEKLASPQVKTERKTPTPAVTNRPPTLIVPASSIRTIKGVGAQFVVSVSDPDAGQTHHFAISAAPMNGKASISKDGLIKFMPRPGFIGQDKLEVAATDDGKPPLTGKAAVRIVVFLPEKPGFVAWVLGFGEETRADSWKAFWLWKLTWAALFFPLVVMVIFSWADEALGVLEGWKEDRQKARASSSSSGEVKMKTRWADHGIEFLSKTLAERVSRRR